MCKAQLLDRHFLQQMLVYPNPAFSVICNKFFTDVLDAVQNCDILLIRYQKILEQGECSPSIRPNLPAMCSGVPRLDPTLLPK